MRQIVLWFTLVSAPALAVGSVGSGGLENWIPARQVATDGEFHVEYFSEKEQRALENWMRPPERPQPAEGAEPKAASAPSGCDVHIVTSTSVPQVSPEATLRRQNVVLGKVVEIEPGFHHGRVASLLRVEVGRWLKSDRELSRGTTVGFIIPEGMLEISGTTYCAEGREGQRLQVGQSVLFGADLVLDREQLIFYPRTKDVFFEGTDGMISVDGVLPEDLVTWRLLEARVQSLSGGE